MYIDKSNEVLMNHYRKQEIIKANERIKEGMPIVKVLQLADKEFIKTDELLDAIANLDKVVKYVDIPLQHSHPRVLESMLCMLTVTLLDPALSAPACISTSSPLTICRRTTPSARRSCGASSSCATSTAVPTRIRTSRKTPSSASRCAPTSWPCGCCPGICWRGR